MIPQSDPNATQRPCLALMGEFSAGKSTLANLLIGADPLPVQVIATRLPPVCISFGEGPAHGVRPDGSEVPVNLNNLGAEPIEGFAYIQIFHDADILEHCDLLDMPGISDPNMPAEIWRRAIRMADGVLWCSHATQAWRQSEAAVWEELPDALRATSLLLLTRFDKLPNQADRDRVLSRVRKETAGLFCDVLPISLLDAGMEEEDHARWAASGAEELAMSLAELVGRLPCTPAPAFSAPAAEPDSQPTMTRERTEPPRVAVSSTPRSEAASDQDKPRVVPRRISAGSASSSRKIAV